MPERDHFYGRRFHRRHRGAYAHRCMMIRNGIHDYGCSLKNYRRECYTNVNLYGELQCFIPAVFILITGVHLFVYSLMAGMIAKNCFTTTRDVSYSIKSVEVREKNQE